MPSIIGDIRALEYPFWKSAMRIDRTPRIIWAYISLIFLASPARLLVADEPNSEPTASAAGDEAAQAAERKRLRQQAAERVGKVKITLVEKPDRAGELVANPLMSYTDEPLSIDAATLWAWGLKKAGRPIAVCKVEHYDKARRAVPAEWL
jgi:hypothetical protein